MEFTALFSLILNKAFVAKVKFAGGYYRYNHEIISPCLQLVNLNMFFFSWSNIGWFYTFPA